MIDLRIPGLGQVRGYQTVTVKVAAAGFGPWFTGFALA
jgi:hypothetical protein